MQEILTVKNFVVIKKAEIELKKINIIIGPQANGKSLLAKLTYFFKSIPAIFIESIRSLDSKRELDAGILSQFESRFPRYSWDGTSFTIQYVAGEFTFVIEGKASKKGKTQLKLSYPEALLKLFNSKKISYKRKREGPQSDDPFMDDWRIMNKYVTGPLQAEYDFFKGQPIFIPASRSFFANLQKNIFTFLASSLEIDLFLKDFGRMYEQSKRFYTDPYLVKRSLPVIERHKDLVESIMSGTYKYEDDQDWLISKGRKINLANASSGQQESLPMLLVLMIWPSLRGSEPNDMYFIEEPEAHLFPTSQSRVVSLLSRIQHDCSSSFFITSHSPYILSAFNNLILAQDTIELGRISIDEFIKVNGPSQPIKFEDVSAYTIDNGVSNPIADPEYRMIGADMLDGISEHFERVMNTLLSSEAEQ